MLFEAVRFAVAVAQDTDGAFDPVVGARMMAAGFDREHRSGRRLAAPAAEANASFRDVLVDEQRRTIMLRCPLTLDLGAVAKGLAVDAAARELQPFRDFAIDAGGDLFLSGSNHHGAPWRVGIRHPRAEGEIVETLCLSDAAVCTSGDDARGHHILDARTGDAATAVASVTVIAPNAMLADALATAAFVLGARDGIALLERHGVQGVVFRPDMTRHATADYPRE
jgi:thiamine biosynthesis lipoprotein